MTDGPADSAKQLARDEQKAAYMRRMYDRHAERFRAAGSEDAPSVARAAHGEMDGLLERDRKRSADSGDIQCRKGCAHCCHGPVEIWPQEAALLVEAARAAGIEPDRVRLERQARQSIDGWHQQPAADRACGFLGSDGACRVYDSRPNACRKLHVVADPELCDGSKYPPDPAGRWFSWEAEVMESAALDVFGRALMPRALLAALDGKSKVESRKSEGKDNS
jgi:Fe-S-cluster containining protein